MQLPLVEGLRAPHTFLGLAEARFSFPGSGTGFLENLSFAKLSSYSVKRYLVDNQEHVDSFSDSILCSKPEVSV